jgi:hypothetical protein
MMKKAGSLVAAVATAITLFAADASAQRSFVERPGADVGVRFPGDWRAANSLRNLNDELRQAQYESRAFRGDGRRARYRLARVAGATDRLNYEYNKRLSRPFLIHRRAEQLRVEVRAIRRDLRGRRGWRWR